MGLKTWVSDLKKKFHLHLWTGWGVVESRYVTKGHGIYSLSKYCTVCGVEKRKTIRVKDFKHGRTS